MALVSHSPWHLPRTPFPSPRASLPPKRRLSFTVRAADGDKLPESEPSATESGDRDPFESRLSKVRFRYQRSGAGKKAERRKAKKAGGAAAAGKSGSGMYLPPVRLKEAVSEGVKVEFGFSPYSERVNGRIAMLGLTALILVELAAGRSVINYHTPGIVLIQLYCVAAVAALFVKYEKEKVSVWPQSPSSAAAATKE